MNRYICVHGHFYQPPRENPWLESIEVQDSAYPYHDWNERITHESYGPNAAARILDDEGWILAIENNYARISFNFGPTLLAWMEHHEPDIYRAVIEADRLSQERFSGHGSALAQVYNHPIMPLANRRDKVTQVVWGIRDFEHRFGRSPEGMWLPETAVDLESLEILADHGIRFTILAPHQAARFREIGATDDAWIDVNGARIDPTRPYRVDLGDEKSIIVFFYDGPISRAVAFEGLLSQGEALASRLVGGFADERDWPQLVHIATDGETYGHHHRHGEMALAYALHYIEERELATLTNYAEYLDRHPPAHEAEILDETSWSCAHGVERWRSDCGCNIGANPEWNQAWRGPLRAALDWLRDELAPFFESRAGELLTDPWAARDAYIDVVLDRSPESTERFLAAHTGRELGPDERITTLKLLELQRHAMLMYTSCGWFFDELSGIETVQVIQYAARAVQLADELAGGTLEEEFVERLAVATSNVLRYRDGRDVYGELVRPASVDLPKVAAHYAMNALFVDRPPDEVYCFDVDPEIFDRHETGRARLAVGRLKLRSRITGKNGRFAFGVLHLGDHNLDGGVRPYRGDEEFEEMRAEVGGAFERADFPETIRLIDRHFGDHPYSLGSLFRDEQRRITTVILENTLAETESVYRHVYEDNAPLMRFLDSAHVPLPRALRTAAEFIMNADIRRALEEDPIDLTYIRNYFHETRSWGLELDVAGISFAMDHALARLSAGLGDEDAGPEQFDEITDLIELIGELPFSCDLWTTQNDYHETLQTRYPSMKAHAEAGDPLADDWVEAFQRLGRALSIRVG